MLIDELNAKIKDKTRLDELWDDFVSSDRFLTSPYTPAYYAELGKDEDEGLYVVVYGAKFLEGSLHIQPLVCITERGNVYGRNCYFGTGCNNGFRSYGYTGKGNRYLPYHKSFCVCEDPDFLSRIETNFYYRTTFTLEDIVRLDPSLEHCGFTSMSGIHLPTYARMYRMYPETCEILMKNGLYRMIRWENLKEISDDKVLRRYLVRNAETFHNSTFRTARNAYRKNRDADPADYLSSLYCRCQAGREAAIRDKELYRDILKYTTQEKIAKYIRDQRTNKNSYGDYLKACRWLHLDFSDTKVLFPHDFHALHDDYTRQYSRYREEIRLAEQAVKDEQKRIAQESMAARMLETAQKFSYLASSDSDYVVIVAQSKEDLITEGSALNHCVGRMHYDERQADGKSVICFLRRSSEPDVPYVPIEVKITDHTLSVSQCYGERDRIVPEVKPFVDSWIRKASRHYRRMVE